MVALIVAAPAAAQVLPTCTASATTVNFGTYDPSSGLPDDTSGSVTVSCLELLLSGTVNTTVALSAGGAGNFSPRKMGGPAASGLPYNLYTSGSHSMIWGDGTRGSSTVPVAVTLSGGVLGLIAASGSTTTAIYGRIPPSQAVTAGAYADSIIVTVTY